MIKTVKVEDAIGLKLAHDITEIRPGEFKGAGFPPGAYRLWGGCLPLAASGKESSVCH